MSDKKPWRDKNRLRELYVKQSMSQPEIASKLGCSQQTVSDWLTRHGIEKQKPWTDEGKLRKAYVGGGRSASEVADMWGCSRSTIENWLDRFNIQTHYERRDKPWLDKENLVREYIENDHSKEKIAAMWDCEPGTIKDHLQQNDLTKYKAEYPRIVTSRNSYEQFLCNREGSEKVAIHRLVAVAKGADPHEVFAGRENHVHHKNGVGWDNRPSNIELLSASEHGRIHASELEREDGRWVSRNNR